MANTTYDAIYSNFIRITRVPELDLPSTDQSKYLLINNAIDRYNIRVIDEIYQITSDDTTETVDAELKSWQLRIIALYMKYVILDGNKDYKSALFVLFTKELGIRNIATQTKDLVTGLEKIETLVDEVIFNSFDSDLNEG